jgi:MoaA/NifB/PqqE/SkfB family radical SAM enzyme
MEFELDNTCNLECTICAGRLSSAIRRNRDKLPPFHSVYNSDFVAQLEEFIPHLEEARFYGGEPFLIKLYYEIWDMMIKINPQIKIYIQTNGTILNERIKKMIERGKFIFNISIDAMDKQVFEKLRVNADFDSVMENLMYFYNYSLRKKTFFCITPTMMRNNWQELPELIRFCNKLNVPLFYNTLYRPKHLALYSLNEKELEKIINKLEEHDFQQKKNSIQKQNNYYYSDFVNLLRKWKSETSERDNLKEKKLLSKEHARIKLLENLSLFYKSESNKEALSGTLRKIDRILSLFENENELTIIYNKLLETPVPVIIEQAEATDGLDNQAILKMVRNYI